MTETESRWSERVRDWKSSGKTAKEFAAGREFKASTLVYWASCLRRSGAPRPTSRRPRLRMARVVTAARPPADDAIVVTVGAARVAVRAGFDGALLRQVVDALGGRR